jgi:ABC-type glycerol-3-phosphate transport system permease component
MAITASSKRKRQWRILIPRIVVRFWVYVLLVIFAIIFVFPFYTMFVGSFMQDSELFSRYPNLWPRRGFDLTGYRQLFAELNYGRPLLNSFVVATGRTLGSLFFCSLAGFAFAKRHFPGRDKLFFFMLATMMLPTQITLIPWYLLMVKYLKWGNTFLPLWIPVWASAFGIFLMRQFIASSVPDEMLEAATIDGASVFGMFIRVVLPIITPGLAVLAILTFVEGFNDFLGPLLILSDSRMFTAPLALANFKGSTIIAPRYSLMFAGSVLATIPLLVVFFAFQRQLISGILSGAIKGGG